MTSYENNSKKKDQQKKNFNLLNRVSTFVRENELLHESDRVVVAVSGGGDSLALLHLLHSLELDLKLLAVYINHQLRPKEIWQEINTVEKTCRTLNIQFVTRTVNVPLHIKTTGCSPEEGARILRYTALEQTRQAFNGSAIAVAHTADDQVEEFLIRLIRGSGMKGLSGMSPLSGKIVRPLLLEKKSDLLDYLQSNDITFCLDSSNLEPLFLRNRIRLELLPDLEENFNPSIRTTILQCMDILRTDNGYLDESAREAFQKSVKFDGDTLKLSLSRTGTSHQAITRRILEKCFWRMSIRPDFRKIVALMDFISNSDNGREIHLSDGVRVVKHKNYLVFSRPLSGGKLRGSPQPRTFSPVIVDHPGSWPVEELGISLHLKEEKKFSKEKNTLYMDMESITFPLVLRPPRKGEKFKPFNSPGRKKISRILSERKVEQNRRPGFPVLTTSEPDRIIALPGLTIAHEVQITEKTTRILSITLSFTT
ncbi:tRNA lysidine(34) synthetase TilS [Desulfomarina sp.]